LESGADILLLDNIPLSDLPDFVAALDAVCRERKVRRPLLEVSGGVTVEVLPDLARAGVDRVSVGRLTHSATCLDMSMDVEVL
jgi:nicotinate-nucleotide pyrophosphorylase (carboxylating)